jgi:hypothetical protein
MGLDPQVGAIAQSEVGGRRADRGPSPVMVPCWSVAERRRRTAKVEERQGAGAGFPSGSNAAQGGGTGEKPWTGIPFPAASKLKETEQGRPILPGFLFSWPVVPRHGYDAVGGPMPMGKGGGAPDRPLSKPGANTVLSTLPVRSLRSRCNKTEEDAGH